MNFKEAFKMMKQGAKVKLPSWGGYWCWDSEKETIMMYCRLQDSEKGVSVLDIRETQRVEYTMLNILSDEWQLASEENTPILGGEATFSFGDAIGNNAIAFVGTSGVQLGWLASQADMLAEDWVFVD